MKQDLPVTLFHLLEGVRGVEGRYWYVATIDDTHANASARSLVGIVVRAPSSFVDKVRERVEAIECVIAAAGLFTRRGGANAARSKASPRTVRGRSVVREAEDSDVEGRSVRVRQTALPGQVGESCGRGEG